MRDLLQRLPGVARAGFGATIAIGLVVGLALPVCAQIPSKKKVPASFSNPQKEGTTPPVSHLEKPVEEPDVADAILGDTLRRMFAEGDDHFHCGEWNHTINMFKVVEQGDPHNVETFSLAAFLLWSSDRNDQAIEQLKLDIEFNPNSSYMYDELGAHYWFNLKDPTNAIPYYQKAIEYKSSWPTYHSLAFCYQKLGEWEKAIAVWKEATKFGDDPRATALLKQAEARLKQKNASK